MTKNKRFLITSVSIIIMACFASFDNASAARTAVRGTSAARKTVATTQNTKEQVKEPVNEVQESTTKEEPAPVYVANKTSQFETAVSAVIDIASDDNSFAEEIRRQRAALAASQNLERATNDQKQALQSGSNSCDQDLRKCMIEKCGNNFTGCALDGDTIFGDKLNSCKRNTKCSGEEFSLFAKEIKADRDLNVQLSSYENVVNCGNQYNACLVNECGNTYTKCLGKSAADAAIKKCETIAKECTEADSGLTARFNTAIGMLREDAEKSIKSDEQRLYTLRDSMKSVCENMGAMFDERTFDCVYTVNFFAGANQSTPLSSRKRYAGDTFVCTQEWFGVNVTTFKENALRETRSQTAASSAMLGSGVGTAAGLVASGAVGRALDTQKAKKDLKEECKDQGGQLKNGECVFDNGEDGNAEPSGGGNTTQSKEKEKNKKGKVCTKINEHHLYATYDESGECIIKSCVEPYKLDSDKNKCIKKEETAKAEKQKQKNQPETTSAKAQDLEQRKKALKIGLERRGDINNQLPSNQIVNGMKQTINNATNFLPTATQRAIKNTK